VEVEVKFTVLLFVVLMIVCITLSGCIYSSANLIRAKGDSIYVIHPAGIVDCKNASVTLYRSTDAASYMKNPDQKYPKVPPRPTIDEDGTDITIGKAPAKTVAPAEPTIEVK
jgi:hypothetical protein